MIQLDCAGIVRAFLQSGKLRMRFLKIHNVIFEIAGAMALQIAMTDGTRLIAGSGEISLAAMFDVASGACGLSFGG